MASRTRSRRDPVDDGPHRVEKFARSFSRDLQGEEGVAVLGTSGFSSITMTLRRSAGTAR